MKRRNDYCLVRKFGWKNIKIDFHTLFSLYGTKILSEKHASDMVVARKLSETTDQ